jgi:hypothetical protein
MFDPGDDLRRVLIHDQPDRDAIASDLLRKARASTSNEKRGGCESRSNSAWLVTVRLPVLGRWSDAPTPLYVPRCSAAGWPSGPDRGFHRLALRFNPGPRR